MNKIRKSILKIFLTVSLFISFLMTSTALNASYKIGTKLSLQQTVDNKLESVNEGLHNSLKGLESGDDFSLVNGEFGDEIFSVKSVVQHESGNLSLVIKGLNGDSVMTVTPDDRVVGTVRMKEESLSFKPSNSPSVSSVSKVKADTQLDEVVFKGGNEAGVSKVSSKASGNGGVGLSAKVLNPPNDILTLVFGVTDVINNEYSGAALTALFDQYITEFNTAAINSNVTTRIEHAGGVVVKIEDGLENDVYLRRVKKLTGPNFSGSYDADFGGLTPEGFSLEDVRLKNGAEIVAVLSSYNAGSSICGAADLGGRKIQSFECPDNSAICWGHEQGYVSVDVGDDCNAALTLAHEVGHVLGAGHQIELTSGQAAYPEGHGYVFDTSGQRGTVMASQIFTGNTLQFSSPDRLCDGMVCGVAGESNVSSMISKGAANVEAVYDGVLSPLGQISAANPLVISKEYRSSLSFNGSGVQGTSFNVELMQNGTVIDTQNNLMADVSGSDNYGISWIPPIDTVAGDYQAKITSSVIPENNVMLDFIKIDGGAPVVNSITLGAIGSNDVAVSFDLNTRGLNVTVSMEFVDQSGIAFTKVGSIDAFFKDVTVALVFDGLECEKAYVATPTLSNADGEVVGSSMNVTTGMCSSGIAPAISGVSIVSGEKSLSAVAVINANMSATSVKAETSSNGATIESTVVSVGSAETAQSVSLVLAGLDCGSSYDVTITGSNEFGDSFETVSQATMACASGTIGFTSNSASVGEGNSSVVITVSRTGGSDGAASINYATENGTAGDSDYTAASGVLSWADGDSGDKNITVSINDDSVDENSESFTVVLSGQSAGVALGESVNTVTISDNDAPVVVNPPTPPSSGDSGGGGSMGFVMLLFMSLVGVRKRLNRVNLLTK